MDENGRGAEVKAANDAGSGAVSGDRTSDAGVTALRETGDELRALLAEQAALRRVATLVASEGDASRIFAVVTREVGCLLGAHTANMIRFDDQPSATVVGGWSADGVPNVTVGSTVPLDGETAASQVWRTGEPARLDSYDNQRGALAVQLRALGFRCAVGAPVVLAGRLWGAVLVSSMELEPFPPGAELRIASFAELVGQALANAEALEQLAASRARLVRAADAERKRLERNLHDGAQQRLVSVAVLLQLAERQLTTDPQAAQVRLVAARAELSHALAELRELARGLHPAILTDQGLGVALETLAIRAPVPVKLSVELEGRLADSVQAAAYYVVCEALTNVAKYAHATAVRVNVECAGTELIVTIVDDGIGGADQAHGTGLRGLNDRVEAVGGQLELHSPPATGTTLRARIPCQPN